jgi:hypothetical protein
VHLGPIHKYPTLLDSRSPELGLAGGSVESQEDGDSYALVSDGAASSGSSLYLYLRATSPNLGIIRRNVQLRAAGPTPAPPPTPPTPHPTPGPPTPSLPTPNPPTPIACDTRNASVSAIVVGGAGTAAVNGRYARTNSTSDGLPIFSLDQEHQLYSKRTWRLAYFQNYLYYVSSDGHSKGPPVANKDEWSPTGKGGGGAPSSIVCEYSV